MRTDFTLPQDINKIYQHAKKLEWLTFAYVLSVLVVMYLTLGTSQAMKAVWLEDFLTIVPSTGFLISSAVWERTRPDKKFPYGYSKIYEVAFLAGSFALLVLGAYLVTDSAIALFKEERPTIGSVRIFGHTIWQGWVMMIALLYSTVPAVFIGRRKKPLAEALHSRLIYIDSKAQAADYRSGGAAIIGIILIGFGYWWGDAVTAILIGLSIFRDGYINIKTAIFDIMDTIPTRVTDQEPVDLTPYLQEVKELSYVEDASMRFRETGFLFFGEIYVKFNHAPDEQLFKRLEEIREKVYAADWRIHDIEVIPVEKIKG